MSGGRRIGAVLTGDIVRSSALSSGDLSRLIEAISEAVDAVKGWEPSIVIGAPEFFRGDSWQVLVGRPEMALRAALRIRAGAVASGVADTRIAIAIGNIEPFDAEHISRSSSEAFVASGRLADAMGKRRLALALPAVFGPLGTWVSLGDALPISGRGDRRGPRSGGGWAGGDRGALRHDGAECVQAARARPVAPRRSRPWRFRKERLAPVIW